MLFTYSLSTILALSDNERQTKEEWMVFGRRFLSLKKKTFYMGTKAERQRVKEKMKKIRGCRVKEKSG